MPPRAKGRSAPVLKGQATANVEAVAKASYEVKKQVTQEIPPDVTRARTSAWLDLISPVTEWAGLRGDQLRARRALLRLQQEDALNAIARRAAPKLKVLSGRPIPNKFMVPFLEQASLEDAADSSLIDMWADLLVSASEKFESYHTHFVSIIAQLSGKQAEIFKKIVNVADVPALERQQDEIRMWYTNNRLHSLVYRKFYEHVQQERELVNPDEVVEILQNILGQSGVDTVYCSFEESSRKSYEVEIEWSHYEDDLEVDYSILEAVGLIRRVEASFAFGDWQFEIVYYHVTDLGAHFAKSCGTVAAPLSADA